MINLTITFDGCDYRVPSPEGGEAGAYYTDDKQDAIDTAYYMHREAYPQIGTLRFKKVDIHPEV